MKTICISENTNKKLKDFFITNGHQLIEVRKTPAVYDSVAAHSDIYLCKLREELIVAPEQYPLIADGLIESGIPFSVSTGQLGSQYPMNIRYNAAQVGTFLIHNTKYTDPLIIEKAKKLGLQLVHVKQGYTKCNLVIVDDHSAITSDAGIAEELSKYPIEVLLIAQGHIALDGFPYGFLGGASGKVGSQIIFNGNLSAHPDFQSITAFIQSRGLQVVYFDDYPLADIGSIINFSRIELDFS